MLNTYQKERIVELRSQGKTYAEIRQITGHAFYTITKYLGTAGAHKYRKNRNSPRLPLFLTKVIEWFRAMWG